MTNFYDRPPSFMPMAHYVLKPYLRSSSLHAKGIPSCITDEEIRYMFKDFQVLRIKTGEIGSDSQRWGYERGTRAAQIEFLSIAVGELPCVLSSSSSQLFPTAERALAVLNHRIIREDPLVFLKLSATSAHLSPASGHPRLVKSLPPYYDADQLYTLIRPFGPLASARIDETLGAVVQFWDENIACAAEIAVLSAFSQTSKITLQSYDPCTIFCAVSMIIYNTTLFV